MTLLTQQQERERVAEVKIQQKINAANREAWAHKFPHAVEHMMRLVSERLQQGLRKDNATPLTNREVYELSQSLGTLYGIHLDLDAN